MVSGATMKNGDKVMLLSEKAPDDFFEKYQPIPNKFDDNVPYDGCMYETYGQEYEYVKSMIDSNRVFTITDDGENICITAGLRLVNRYGYLITEQPYGDENECYPQPSSQRHEETMVCKHCGKDGSEVDIQETGKYIVMLDANGNYDDIPESQYAESIYCFGCDKETDLILLSVYKRRSN